MRISSIDIGSNAIRQLIAETLQECHDETLQIKLGNLYLILENFLSDEQVVQYDKLREFGEQAIQGIHAGKPGLEILTPLAHIQMDNTIDSQILEGMKKRNEELEAFKVIAAMKMKDRKR